jgi:hypothetical protein
MGRYLKVLAAVTALGAAAAFAPTAAANSYSVAIGTPGFALGYSNYGYGGYVGYGPPYYYAPYYYDHGPYYYGPSVAFYYGPLYYHHHHYYRHW